MAGNTYCKFPSGLWETSTCQAFPIPPDVSAWQYNTTNYTDPSLGLEIPCSLERIFLGQAQTFSLEMSTTHLLFFYRSLIAFIAEYSLFYLYLEPDMSELNLLNLILNFMPCFWLCFIAASVIPWHSSTGVGCCGVGWGFHITVVYPVQMMFFHFIYTRFYPGWFIWEITASALVHIFPVCSLSVSLWSVCCGSDNNFSGQTNKLRQNSLDLWPVTCGLLPADGLTLA